MDGWVLCAADAHWVANVAASQTRAALADLGTTALPLRLLSCVRLTSSILHCDAVQQPTVAAGAGYKGGGDAAVAAQDTDAAAAKDSPSVQLADLQLPATRSSRLAARHLAKVPGRTWSNEQIVRYLSVCGLCAFHLLRLDEHVCGPARGVDTHEWTLPVRLSHIERAHSPSTAPCLQSCLQSQAQALETLPPAVRDAVTACAVAPEKLVRVNSTPKSTESGVSGSASGGDGLRQLKTFGLPGHMLHLGSTSPAELWPG